jgi:hypothetical protein
VFLFLTYLLSLVKSRANDRQISLHGHRPIGGKKICQQKRPNIS